VEHFYFTLSMLFLHELLQGYKLRVAMAARASVRGWENRAGCGPKIHWLRHCSISHRGASDGGRWTDGMHSRRAKIAG